MKNELKTEIKNGVLTISIGLEILAFAIENGPDWDDQYIIDKGDDGKYTEFGKSMFYALEKEEEDGTTLVHRLFDGAAEYALEQGFEGFLDTEEGP